MAGLSVHSGWASGTRFDCPAGYADRLRTSASRCRRGVSRISPETASDPLFRLVAGAVCWLRTARSHVSRHPGLMSPDIPDGVPARHQRPGMTLNRLLITSVVVENRPV